MHLISTDTTTWVETQLAGNGCRMKKVDEKDNEKQADDSGLTS